MRVQALDGLWSERPLGPVSEHCVWYLFVIERVCNTATDLSGLIVPQLTTHYFAIDRFTPHQSIIFNVVVSLRI